MGAFFKGVCYSSSTDATAAFYGGASVGVSAGAVAYESHFEYSTAFVPGPGWYWVQTKSVDGVDTITGSPAGPVSFPECDPLEGLHDGFAVGWLLVLTMLVAWSFLLIRGQMR